MDCRDFDSLERLSNEERVGGRILREAVWLARLSSPIREQLWQGGRVRRMAPEQAVYRQGDEPDGLYGVISGRVRLTRHTEEGASRILLVASAGDWFGEVSTLEGVPRPQDARCECETVLLQLPSARIEQLALREPALWRAIGVLASRRQRMATAFIEALSMKERERRVLMLLTAMKDRLDGGLVTLSQDDIAATVGVSRQTVNKTLRALSRRGLVELGYRRIRLTDAASDRELDNPQA